MVAVAHQTIIASHHRICLGRLTREMSSRNAACTRCLMLNCEPRKTCQCGAFHFCACRDQHVVGRYVLRTVNDDRFSISPFANPIMYDSNDTHTRAHRTAHTTICYLHEWLLLFLSIFSPFCVRSHNLLQFTHSLHRGKVFKRAQSQSITYYLWPRPKFIGARWGKRFGAMNQI